MSDKKNLHEEALINLGLGRCDFFSHPGLDQILDPNKMAEIQEIAQKTGDVLDPAVTATISLSANQ